MVGPPLPTLCAFRSRTSFQACSAEVRSLPGSRHVGPPLHHSCAGNGLVERSKRAPSYSPGTFPQVHCLGTDFGARVGLNSKTGLPVAVNRPDGSSSVGTASEPLLGRGGSTEGWSFPKSNIGRPVAVRRPDGLAFTVFASGESSGFASECEALCSRRSSSDRARAMLP